MGSDTQCKDNQRHREAEVAMSIVVYSTCSVSLILLNKLVIDTFHLNYPMGLLFMQNFFAVVLVETAKRLGYVHYPDFDWAIVRKWLPLTVLFVAMLWTSMKSLKLLSVAVQTIVKNLAIILTAIGDWKFFGKRLTPMMFIAFLIMILGSYMGTVGDRWATTEGLLWTFANIAATCSYVLYMKLLLGDVSQHIGRYGPVFYNNLLSLPFIFPACAATLGDMLHDISEAPLAAFACLLLMIIAGSVITFASFWCMRVTSPTTYSVCGSLNKIPLALLGIVIFQHYPTSTGLMGIFVALCGGLLYTWLNRPQPKPQTDVEAMEEGAPSPLTAAASPLTLGGANKA